MIFNGESKFYVQGANSKNYIYISYFCKNYNKEGEFLKDRPVVPQPPPFVSDDCTCIWNYILHPLKKIRCAKILIGNSLKSIKK